MKVITFFISVAGTFLSGKVFLDMWDWFVVSLGAPAIHYWHSMGLVLFTRFFKNTPLDLDSDPEKDMTDSVAKVILILMMWGIGALYSLGM